MKIQERKKEIDVYGEYDVVVLGGGIAGISAALSASRNGAKTLLIDKNYEVGGLATLGLVTIYLPLCDGEGRQISFGIAEELLRLSASHGLEEGQEILEAWSSPNKDDPKGLQTRKNSRFQVRFNAHNFIILAEKALLEAGVEILYGTMFCDCVVEDKKVKAIFIENKTGRQAVCARNFVDATGDADLYYRAGAATRNFKQGNVLAAWYYAKEQQEISLKMLGFCDVPDNEKDENYSLEKLMDKRFTGLDGKELSDMAILAHAQVWKHFQKGGDMTREHCISNIAHIPQIRMTRCAVGKTVLDESHEGKYFADSIGMVADWRKKGKRYEVPFSCLYSEDLLNVISAGRCVSNTDVTWDIMRVIPCCAVTGQAAGTAAALFENVTTADVEKLQKQLQKDGVVIHLSDVGVEY